LKSYNRYLLTGIVVLVAIAAVLLKYWDYVVNPWTRDGQVRAKIVQITPRVTGYIVNLPVNDNQFVKAGDLLYQIDPRTFEASLEQARAQYDSALDEYDSLDKQVAAAEAQVQVSQAGLQQSSTFVKEAESVIARNEAELKRQQELLPQRATSQRSVESARANYEVSVQKRIGAIAGVAQARSSLAQAEADLARAKANRGAPGEDNAKIRAARAALRQAELNLEFTQVRAPVDGFVTNLNLRLGDQAVANQPALALVDGNSFWVAGYFRETFIERVEIGDHAVVTLMAYPDKPLKGYVESLGWGIAQQDGATGFELLPSISPTFEWIRLAQRIPVRVHLTEIPDGVALRVGTTASVLVITGSADSQRKTAVPPVPKALQ
jgi:multidrug resistance efflux pump